MGYDVKIAEVSEDPVLIRRNRDDYGFLGNMHPTPIRYENLEFPSVEALFQCLRFRDEDLRRRIREASNAYKAKLIAKAHPEKRTVIPLSAEDLDNMRNCLWLKVEQHPRIRKALLQTESRTIIEDCTSRQDGSGLFWGAALRGDAWYGLNWLGVLWMETRSILQEREASINDYLNDL